MVQQMYFNDRSLIEERGYAWVGPMEYNDGAAPLVNYDSEVEAAADRCAAPVRET